MRANVRGIEIGYDSVGAGDTTLVLLHAFPLNRAQWERQVRSLAQVEGVRVVAPDLRGFGESSLEVGPTTVEQMAGDVLGLLNTLGIEAFALGGLSMGGYVAFQLYQRAAERVRGMVLADTRATADSPEARQGRETTAIFVEERGVPALFDRDAPRLFSHVTQASRPDIIEEGRRIAALNSPIGVAAAARGLGLRPDVTELLPEIVCPTLIIVGEQDELTPVADARTLFERIPDAQLEVIADGGHLSNLERPELFGELVARFLLERVEGKPEVS
ncbi:MAG: alpha/beta fold hydrolase [Ktedonobacterales bacterium]